ncbi:MAG TPA: hypothetical protein VHZ25_08585 [Acidobacteriaceae bacterium]|nr:hypothetical protein [Acidobacteriaceae bacterium]
MLRSKRAGIPPTLAAFCALPFLAALPLHSQVFTVEAEHVEKHYTEFPPTHVRYPEQPITQLGRESLIRFMQSEQGFAMRPLPIAALTLHANGHMDPTGDKYVDELHQKGMSVKAGDRVVVTDIRIHEKSIELDLNGGPEHKHKYLRHIAIGVGAAEVPLASDNGTPPTGARITLVFEEAVPDLNGEQLQALLKPMIDFGVKSPAEAFAESLPDFLRIAVQDHRVLVGMDRDMVVYSKGQPNRKIRETGEDGKPFEIWVYGEAPQPVEMIRIQGSFVTRVQLARVGEPMEERTQNEMGDYWGNQPAVAANQHEVKLGDSTDSERTEESAPRSAPTLRKPGEQLPADNPKNNPAGSMQPVNMPPDQRRPGDPGYSPTVSAQPQPGQGTQQGSGSGSSQTQPAQGSSSSSQPNGASTTNSTQTNPAPNPPQKQSDSTDQSNPLDKPQ